MAVGKLIHARPACGVVASRVGLSSVPSDTAALVEHHRNLFRDELRINRLVSRQPAVSVDPHTGLTDPTSGTRVGMNMSTALLRRLGHPEGYGQVYPWARALWLLRIECRRAHPQHRAADRPYWRGSLCWQAVSLVVAAGFSAESAATVLRIERIDPILRNGFRFIEEQIDAQREHAERRAREDEGRAITCECGHAFIRHGGITEGWACLHERCDCRRYRADAGTRQESHAQGGMHAADCPKCRRGVA